MASYTTLTVTVDGQTFTVDVRGVSLFSDTGLSQPVSFPLSISADTTWYAAEQTKPGARQITVKCTASDGTLTTPGVTLHALPATVDAPEGTFALGSSAGNASSAPAGPPIVRAFPFAFNSAGISTPNGSGYVEGYPFYAPTAGDFLLDVWITIETAWNGTTPQADVGWFLEGNGLWDSLWPGTHKHVDLTTADAPDSRAVHFITSAQVTRLSDVQGLWNAYNQFILPNPVTAGATLDTNANIDYGARVLPGKFIDSEPIRVIATTTGDGWGANPGSTQGAGTIYLVTVTPAS